MQHVHLGNFLGLSATNIIVSGVAMFVTAIIGVIAIWNAVRLNKVKHGEMPVRRRDGEHRVA